MNSTRTSALVRRMGALAITAALAIPTALHAQDPGSSDRADKYGPRTSQTFYLHNATTQYDFNDVQTALRNMLPMAKIYGVPHVAAITISASTGDLTIAQKLISDLDHPKKTWKLTYTVTETDGDKPSAPQHFSLVVSENNRASLKQGTKVPIATGRYDNDKNSGPEIQMQYQDVGLAFDVTLEGYEEGRRLKTKFEQSAVIDDKGQHTEDPVFAQTMMETYTAFEPGKPVNLGSVAEPNSPHHVSVSVVAELVK